MPAQPIMPRVEDARQAGDPQPPEVKDAGVAQVEDVGRDPAPKGQAAQVVGRLVVAPDEHRQHGRAALARVVLVKLAERPVLGRAREALEVVEVADGLEVPADDEELDLLLAPPFGGGLLVELGDGLVDAVEVAVAAALDGDLRFCFF